jgi:hypothetical protein
MIERAPTAVQWIVLTDAPLDFTSLPNVRAIEHAATGPMSIDYLSRLPTTGNSNGAAAYHDKRFAIQAALEVSDTAIYLDADSYFDTIPSLEHLVPGLTVLPVVKRSIAEHLAVCGSWRRPFFDELARLLTGSTEILNAAKWCHEALMAFRKTGKEQIFFEAWAKCAEYLKSHEMYSGEGGVIGLAAACAEWKISLHDLDVFGELVTHEGGGPKGAAVVELIMDSRASTPCG